MNPLFFLLFCVCGPQIVKIPYCEDCLFQLHGMTDWVGKMETLAPNIKGYDTPLGPPWYSHRNQLDKRDSLSYLY